MRERSTALCIGLLVIGSLIAPVACTETECADPSAACGSPLANAGRPSEESGGAAGAVADAGTSTGGAAEGGARNGAAGVAGDGGADSTDSPGCGDGWVDPGETCDDRSRAAGDGCDSSCQIESGWLCGGDPSRCVDIDECATENGGCGAFADCTNSPGTFSCSACRSGYLGDGESGCAAVRVLASTNIDVCGIKADGAVLCWGAGALTPPPGTFKSLAAGYTHACGIRSDGTVACWGDDSAGQATAPTGTFKAIAAGGNSQFSSFSCGVRTEGDIRCWGGMDTRLDGKFKAIDAGQLHACAIRLDGRVTCWGNGDYGATFLPIEHDSSEFVSLGMGSDYSCGIITSGAGICWGSHVPAYPEGSLRSLVASDLAICAIRADESVACWGDDFSGLLMPPPGTFKALTMRGMHACGLRSDGKAECWGSASVGTTPSDTFQVW